MTYGLGWFEQDYRGRFLAFHTGSLDGRTAMVGLLPEARTGVFIAGNLDHAEFRHALMLQVMDIMAGTNGGPARDWSSEFLALYQGLQAESEKRVLDAEAKRVRQPNRSRPSRPTLASYAHPAWGSVNVSRPVTGSRCAWVAAPRCAVPLEHWQFDTFRTSLGDGRGGKSYLMFQLDAEGKVTRVLMDGSEEYAFTRVEQSRR